MERTGNTFRRIIISDTQEKVYYLQANTLLSSSLEEEKACLDTLSILGLPLLATAAVRTSGCGVSTGASALYRTQYGKVHPPATTTGLFFTVRSCQALWEPRNKATVFSWVAD